MKPIARIKKLKELFDADLIPKQHRHEVNPELPKDDRLNYLYFTLPVSLNFQRNSPAMWKSALETFNDPATNYLFYPELVVKESREKIQADLVKHKLALQKNKHIDIWRTLCQTFYEDYDSDPRKLLADSNNDVSEIINTLRIVKKKDFPYLSGAKMANYWLYILHHFTDIQLTNLDLISIIPDTHVIQFSIFLKLVDNKTTPEKIAETWHTLLKGSGLIPIDLHPVLWNWSRNNFQPEV